MIKIEIKPVYGENEHTIYATRKTIRFFGLKIVSKLIINPASTSVGTYYNI